MQKVKLSELQKDILSFFGRTEFGRNFYWTGGTLLAYHYLYNRKSVDIDFFSENLFVDNDYLVFINKMKVDLKISKIDYVIEMNRRMFLVHRKKEVVKMEMVFFPFPAVSKLIVLKEFNIKASSLVDLMANKILSAYQRHEPKDAFDLYSYLSNKPKYNLDKLIVLATKKFGVEIETLNLFVKLNDLSEKIDTLTPLMFAKDKSIKIKMKAFFQAEFNRFVGKKIR